MKNITPPPTKSIRFLIFLVKSVLRPRKKTTSFWLFLAFAWLFVLSSCQNHEIREPGVDKIKLELRTGNDCSPAFNEACDYDTIDQYSSIYKGCPYNFSVIVKICEGTNGPVVSLYNLKYFPDTSNVNCQIFKNYLDSLYFANNFVQLNYELNELNRALSHGAETVVAYMMKANSEIPYCSSQRAATFDFYESDCLTRCPEEDENGLYFHEISCGDACCVRSRTLCLNDNGVIVYSDPVYVTSGECDDLPAQCERPISSCITPCERL